MESCEIRCYKHPNHVYVYHFDSPTLIDDIDDIQSNLNIPGEFAAYPLTHYVGWTRRSPLARIKEHGMQFNDNIVSIYPGTFVHEHFAKLDSKCPVCGKSLFYYAESPDYRKEYRKYLRGDLLTAIMKYQAVSDPLVADIDWEQIIEIPSTINPDPLPLYVKPEFNVEMTVDNPLGIGPKRTIRGGIIEY